MPHFCRILLTWLVTPRTLLAVMLAVIPLANATAQEKYELGGEGFKKIAEPDPATPQGQLHQFRKMIAEERPYDAADGLKEWIKTHPNHPLLVEAHLIRGDALAAAAEHYKALFEYEEVVRAYPESSQFQIALEREFQIAQTFAAGVRRKLWGMRIIDAGPEAEELFIRIQERAPGSKLAERAGISLADYYYDHDEMVMAAEAYDLFLRNFPKSQWREHSMRRQILANLATFKGPKFDVTSLVEAQRRLSDFKGNFPAAAEQLGSEAMLTRIDESLATRSLLVAQWYERRGNTISARAMYQRVIKDHPGSASAQTALQQLRVLDPEHFAGVPDLEATGQPAPATPTKTDAKPVKP